VCIYTIYITLSLGYFYRRRIYLKQVLYYMSWIVGYLSAYMLVIDHYFRKLSDAKLLYVIKRRLAE